MVKRAVAARSGKKYVETPDDKSKIEWARALFKIRDDKKLDSDWLSARQWMKEYKEGNA